VPDTLVAQLTEKVDRNRALIDMLAERAAEKGVDLSDEDMAKIDDAQGQIRSWNGQLERLTADLELSEDAQNRLRNAGRSGAITAPDFAYRSDGELLWDVLHQTDSEASARYRRVYRRAAEHMGTVAANTTPVAGDLAGLVVKPVVGPVINPYRTGMPLANAIGMRPVPASDGFGFSRPQVVDTGIDTGIAPQALEKAELASKAFTITTTPVALTTVGGYLNISQQLLSFNPASLGIILDQLRVRLERDVEATVLTAVTGGSTAVPIGAAATGPDILQAIYDAAAAYFTATNSLPTWLAMGPLGWARLGGLTDLAGRPLFPTLGASNAPGTASASSFAMTVAGLTPVITPAITDDSLYVGGDVALEGYLYAFPVLEAVEPSVLGRQVAVAASVATHQPPPFTDAIQHLTFA
jgi:HK97 family phage major capsid protein